MISKEQLLKEIDEAIQTEETASPYYMKHISGSVEWFGFPKKDVLWIQEKLHELAEDSQWHRKALVNIRKAVCNNERSLF